jgi:hypothetical protein
MSFQALMMAALLGSPAAASAPLAFASLQGESATPSEYEVKAVYLYNFAKFVRWPGAALEGVPVFTICVVGHDPFGEVLDRVLAGETIHGRPTATRRLSTSGEVDDSCQLLFISDSEKSSLGAILDAWRGRQVLTVSDIDDFSRRGGMIELVLVEDHVRFEVNLTVATRVGLELSSELLKVARAVRRDSSGIPRGAVRQAGRFDSTEGSSFRPD